MRNGHQTRCVAAIQCEEMRIIVLVPVIGVLDTGFLLTKDNRILVHSIKDHRMPFMHSEIDGLRSLVLKVSPAPAQTTYLYSSLLNLLSTLCYIITTFSH